jgi:AAA domain
MDEKIARFVTVKSIESIQQREQVVQEISLLLIDSSTAAVVLTGIGGVGKSTLASLVLNRAERERHAGRGPFQREALLLRINENTTFLEFATNLFAAVDKSMPDLSGISPQNQAYAVFNALNTGDVVDKPRLIILDQFEFLLDAQSGRALPTQAGIGELIDALNSQPCACRLLLTSRIRPHGTRSDAPASLRIYRVSGLDTLEGGAMLRSQGVTGSDADLQEAVRRCNGHALALTLLWVD